MGAVGESGWVPSKMLGTFTGNRKIRDRAPSIPTGNVGIVYRNEGRVYTTYSILAPYTSVSSAAQSISQTGFEQMI